ncbi:MAG: glycerol kinase GlpK [Alphaproteobacteria bacterium]|nr:glycerol kinase GlpK [Alphaproteobacteria bacterium]
MTTRSMILAIDQGTTSSRAMVFDEKGEICGLGQKEYPQFFPQDGWVEQDATQIWRDTLEVCRNAIHNTGSKNVAAIGITNQRETLVVWSRETSEPIYHAIVWQDRRTENACKVLREAGHEDNIHRKTGLRIDSYFSATKLAWILDNVSNAREQAKAGKLAAGTIDCYLLWMLTKGRVHATDATNASRTLLFNIATQEWDEELLRLFNIPNAMLPEVRNTQDNFGDADEQWFGRSCPILAMAGDQQAAALGQACVRPGMWKSTYGTGCFVLMHTGDQQILSQNKLLATIANRTENGVQYALEGSIFVAGAAIKWLRDNLGIVAHASDTAAIAASLESTHGVYMVPAFAGLGAPYWDAQARGAIVGMTLDTRKEHIIRATLEAVAYQTRDLMGAFKADLASAHIEAGTLRVDGGMVANDWFCQFLADMLDVPVERPKIIETTAWGVAMLAGIGAGVYEGLDAMADNWQCERRFVPQMKTSTRDRNYSGWLAAIEKVQHHG